MLFKEVMAEHFINEENHKKNVIYPKKQFHEI